MVSFNQNDLRHDAMIAPQKLPRRVQDVILNKHVSLIKTISRQMPIALFYNIDPLQRIEEFHCKTIKIGARFWIKVI